MSTLRTEKGSRLRDGKSLLVVRVKFEPKSSSSHESSSGQVLKNTFFLNLILISFDCDYCFHNVAPTAAQNINSPRYVTF